jgi:hypothetical protein
VAPLTQRSWALALAGGCAVWAGMAFGRSERVAALVGSTPSEVRALGIRDLASGVLLVVSPDVRLPIALRVAFDVSDAARYGRGRPAVLAMTLGFAGLGVVGLLARRG